MRRRRIVYDGGLSKLDVATDTESEESEDEAFHKLVGEANMKHETLEATVKYVEDKYEDSLLEQKLRDVRAGLISSRNILGSLSESEDDEEPTLFDVHKDEEQFCGRSLSTTTKTELIEINYAIRFYAVYEGRGVSPPTRDVPITIC